VPGIGERTATAIKNAVTKPAASSQTGPTIVSVNTATGEIEEE